MHRVSALLWVAAVAAGAPAASGDDPAAALDRAIAEAARRAAAAVVAIEVERDESAPAPDDGPRGVPAAPGGRMRSLLDYYSRPKGPVSGVILEADGWIATSLYNVAGAVRSVTVVREGSRLPATLLGSSEVHDIALLKVEAKDLPVLPAADPAEVVPGRFCVVVGRSPVPARPTVAWGVVSAARRWQDTAVQTDAEMNFGNAGGALVDLEGRLIGVAGHIADRTVWGQSSGVGFAARVEKIREILPRLKAGEKLEREAGWLGVEAAEEPHPMGGVVVREVLPDSPAAAAGLRAGDVIQDADEKPMMESGALAEELHNTPPGTVVRLRVRRGEETLEVEVTLGRRPKAE